MEQNDYIYLTELLSSFKQELTDINAQIHSNLLYIKEEEACVRSFENSNNDEFKLFSPRVNDSFKRDEIEKSNARKADYEKENLKLYERKTKLENKITQLEKVLDHKNQNASVFAFQEKDHQCIVRDLHDISVQNLLHLVRKIELCGLYVDEDPVKAKLELSVIGRSLKEVVNEIENTVFDLRLISFVDSGLKASLESLLENINRDKQYNIVSEIDDVSCENKFILFYLCRVVQESLNNIVKYSEANKIEFCCKVLDGICVIEIIDNGNGFNVEEEKENQHLGLSLMQEGVELLNGVLEINSIKGEGTKIHMEIPFVD